MRKVLLIGTTSAIAQETAKLFAAEGATLFLVARNEEKLGAVADDLRVRGAKLVVTYTLDVNDFDKHVPMIRTATEQLGGLDTVLIAYGTLPEQKVCESSYEETFEALQTNCLSVISLLTHLANLFERQGFGTIAVISSVVGDRGRQSNYVYGTAKGAVTIFLQGLRNRLHKSGVHVLTVKPGYVDTPMTSAFEKGFLWAKPDRIAAGIIKAVKTKKDTVYLPWFWAPIMTIVKSIPEPLFKRLSL